MFGKWRGSRQLVSTLSVQTDLQFDRCLMTACSLMLMVVLVVGAAGSAGMQRLLSSTTTTAEALRLERVKLDADPDSVVTPAAIALALIAVVLVAVTARAASPRSYSIDTP
jgi:pheromone shutdown protein TraB